MIYIYKFFKVSNQRHYMHMPSALHTCTILHMQTCSARQTSYAQGIQQTVFSGVCAASRGCFQTRDSETILLRPCVPAIQIVVTGLNGRWPWQSLSCTCRVLLYLTFWRLHWSIFRPQVNQLKTCFVVRCLLGNR